MAVKKENSGSTKQYRCPHCDTLHDTRAEAQNCCTDDIEVVYCCDECGEEFDAASLAKSCCPQFSCSKCGNELAMETQVCSCGD